MRNVNTNLSPDLLGLLLQNGSLSRAKAGQGSEGLEALLANGGEGQEESNEGFQNLLSMLTLGQGEAPTDSNEISEVPKTDGAKPDPAMSEILASLNLNATKTISSSVDSIPMPRPMMTKMTKTNELHENVQQSLHHLPLEKIPTKNNQKSLENIGLDLQKILANSNLKVPNSSSKVANTNSIPVAAETIPSTPNEEDSIQLSLMKRDVEQSPIVPNKLTTKTKGLLTGGDFVGLKNGFEQNQFESLRHNLSPDQKRPIPTLYQAEQNTMFNNLASKKQNGMEDGFSMLSNKSPDALPITGMVIDRDANTQRFESTLKTLNMKGQAELKTGNGLPLDTKVHDLMGKISDYIVQARFDKNNTLDVTLHHSDLGQFQMKVSKGLQGSGLEIAIRPHSIQAEKFFTENQQSLIKGLNDSGLKILDLKISSSTLSGGQSFAENKSDNSNSQFTGARSGAQHFQSNQNNSEQDSERRRQLWEQARERLETQYA